MADSILRDKATEFAKTIVFLCRDMKANHKESVLINQLLRLKPLNQNKSLRLALDSICTYKYDAGYINKDNRKRF